MKSCKKTNLFAIIGAIIASVFLIGGCTYGVTSDSGSELNSNGVESSSNVTESDSGSGLNGNGVESSPNVTESDSGSELNGNGAESSPNVTELEFGFRAKKTSMEEASDIIGVVLPMPTYLPESYKVQEVYIGMGDSQGPNTVLLLISDEPIQKEMIPAFSGSEYPGYDVKCKIVLYIFYRLEMFPKIDSTTPGVNVMVNQNPGVIEEQEDGDVIYWSLSVEPAGTKPIEVQYVTLMLGVNKGIPREELIKIAESVR